MMAYEVFGIPLPYFLLILFIITLLAILSREEIKVGDKVNVKWHFPGTESWSAHVLRLENKTLSSLPKPLGGTLKVMRTIAYVLLIIRKVAGGILATLIVSLFLSDWLGLGRLWWLPAGLLLLGCVVYGTYLGIKKKD